MAERYLPLYRKYRPSTFHDVVGQEVVVKTLLNAIEHNRVAHAYLFCGPRGTGKTSIARIFAKTLNCQNLVNGEPCGKCPHCMDMNNNVSMDVIEIDAASNRKVEDARNLLEQVQYTPVLGKNKIYIIDEVHMLTKEAFNTLLKTLEEPPENLIFILATTEANKVLETIVSRCQKFDFRRISVEDIKNRLLSIAKKENINIEEDAIEFIARRSAGGLRDALALLDQSTVLALDNKSITKQDIVTLLGSVDDNDLYGIADLISKKDATNVVNVLKNIVDKGNEPTQIIKELINYFRNLMIASVSTSKEECSKLLDISPENCERILKQSKEFSTQELVQIIENLANNEINVRNSSNPYLWLDVAIINAASRENITAQKALLERIENLENQLKMGFVQKNTPIQNTPIQQVNIKPVETKAIPVINTQVQQKQVERVVEPIKQEEKTVEPIKSIEKPDIKEETEIKTQQPKTDIHTPLIDLNWDTFLGELHNPAVFALVKTQAKPITANSDLIELVCKNDMFVDKIKQKQPLLEETAKKLCGTIPKIIIRKVTDADFKKKTITDNSAQQVTENKIETEIKQETHMQLQPTPPESKVTVEEVKDVEEDIKSNENTKEYLSIYDLTDETRQIMEVFSGKFID